MMDGDVIPRRFVATPCNAESQASINAFPKGEHASAEAVADYGTGLPPNRNEDNSLRYPRDVACRAIAACLLILAGVGAFAATPETSPIPDPSTLCYEEIASVGSNYSSPNSHRFKHVYQYVPDAPYYRYVGEASIAIERKERSAPMYRVLEGRRTVGKGHYALLEPYGTAVVSDVSINIGTGEFAYLFFEDELPDSPGRNTRSHLWGFGQIKDSRVATSVDQDVVLFKPGLKLHSHSFYEVQRGTTWRHAESDRDRWRGERRYWQAPDNVEHRPPTGNPRIRTVNTARKRVTRIAGQERTQEVFCRYANSPLAVTNHDLFLPVIERELERWKSRVVEPLQLERVAEIPKTHTGDFVYRDEFGTIAVRFDRSRDRALECRFHLRDGWGLTHRYAVDARLYVYGQDLGVVAQHSLGTASGERYDGERVYEAHAQRIERAFERGGFSWSGLKWPSNGAFRFDCSESTCVLEVQRWYLDKFRS